MKILALLVLMASTAPNSTAAPLPTCPPSPNCVSSQAADSHHIEPFKITGDAGIAFEKLRKILAQRTDTLVSADEGTIRVEFRTMLGFVDDGLFVLDAANGFIQVRSAARLGY